MQPVSEDDDAPHGLWTAPIDQVLTRLGTTSSGLSSEEAARRLAAHGANRIEPDGRRRLALDILRRLANPLVLVLLFAAGVSAVVQDPASFVIITVIVLLSLALDLVQERRAEAKVEGLRARVALRSTVLRDGSAAEIPAAAIVPGDVILLAAGDLVPADCRLIEARDLFVNEALLTGEAFPAEKTVRTLTPEEARDATGLVNAAFMGSSVISGTARAVIVATGRATELGRIAGALHRPAPPTAFAAGIHGFGMLIVRLTVLLVLFALLANLLLERPLIDSFLFSLALAVGLTPELLPMIVSVTLAHGAMRMARKEVIVKRLSAVHDLGAMEVLCCDKTGTLTEARIRLIRELDPTGAESRRVLDLACLNAAFETGIRSPLDAAIVEAARIDTTAWRKIDEVPFDFERRRVSVLVERDGTRLLVVKGAPEDVMRLASRVQAETDAAPRPFDDDARAMASDVFERLGSEGFRVLGIAWREVGPEHDHAVVDDESDLVFGGFAAFLDPPKESARPALAELARLGVAVKIVTGDNERVTAHVCGELGLAVTGVMTGDELAQLTDEALAARLETTTLFCRMTPPQKARVIRALRRSGRVTGYLGDGINDAPSLHAADVGLSVDSAVDVAREAAVMVLTRNDLGVLAEGVREGRRTFANIMKYVMMGTSSNFGNMVSMAAAVLFLPFLPMLPVQILLNNLLYDVSEIAIPLDQVDEETVAAPCRWDMRFVRDFMLVLGPVSSAFDMLTFGLLLIVFDADAALFRTGWFIESMATQVLVIFAIRTVRPAWRSLPHPLLAAGALAVVAVAVGLPFTPLGAWFGFVPPSAALLAALAAITVAYLAVVEEVKRRFHARHPLVAGPAAQRRRSSR
ncbi:magnesium-translocating P-type ATPase [Elioraea tepidiphila]|jgi:Mg2+-importing ATPase|uniref:magnesium-translocating P-type ATPase n=1 Tax=Elioraea tepidiphila TaxID=457934 RepID=UPI002FDA0591